MDTTLLALLIGIALAVQAFTLVAVAFSLWFWAYRPFVVVRRDMKALDQKVTEAVAFVSKARVLSRSDEDVALIEARLRARERARGAQASGE